jgi:hypothetical protein
MMLALWIQSRSVAPFFFFCDVSGLAAATCEDNEGTNIPAENEEPGELVAQDVTHTPSEPSGKVPRATGTPC